MDYNNLYYYDNDNEVIKTLRQTREEMTYEDPIGGYTFRSSGTRTALDLLVHGLLYFSNICLQYRDMRIGRNDWLDQYVIDAPRNINTLDYDETMVGGPSKLTLCTVAGQVTDFFENTLRNNTPLYDLPDDSPFELMGWEEINGLSLALKVSPRHRIRVYKYTVHEKDTDFNREHFVIYSAKSFQDDDWLLKRKVYAALPYMLGLTEDNPLTAVLRALENTDCEAWLELVDTHLKSIEKYVYFKRHKLVQSFNLLNNMHTASLERRRSSLDGELKTILDSYRNKLQEQQRVLNEIAGMSDANLAIEDINLLIDKSIVKDLIVLQHESVIDFTVTSPVLSFEKEAAIKYYKSIPDTAEVYKALIKHAFIEEDVILFFSDRVRVDFNNYSFNARSEIRAPQHQFLFRNPHHAHFNCWGGYASAITKLISEFNFMQLFMQIKAGVGSINMTDYVVLNHFKNDVHDLYNRGNSPKVIAFKENPSVTYTLKEAYTIWKSREEQTA